jgi:GNAT superfamily N-acetyltransferase
VTGDAALTGRMLATLRHVQDLVAVSSGGQALEFDGGVHAPIVPSAPCMSFFNAVVYDHAAALETALPAIAAAYAEAGIWAWTVWVPEADMDAAALLASVGHVLDGAPRAMVLDLGFRPPVVASDDVRPTSHAVVASDDLRPTSQIERTDDLETFGRVSGEVFGMYPQDVVPPPVVGNPLAGIGGAAHLYVARLDDEVVATAGVYDHDGDAGVYWVATAPEARGRGLAGALMTRAMDDARERGCLTSSLQATAMGAPIYARLGFRDLGAVQMWERRSR